MFSTWLNFYTEVDNSYLSNDKAKNKNMICLSDDIKKNIHEHVNSKSADKKVK